MGRLDPQPVDIQLLSYTVTIYWLANYLQFIIELNICNVNVTGGVNYLKTDVYRSHKDKDNVVCVYYQGQNL